MIWAFLGSKNAKTISGEPQYQSNYLIYNGSLGYLEKFFKGYAFMQICSELLIEKMFYYKFFCQTIQCPQKEGGGFRPPPMFRLPKNMPM